MITHPDKILFPGDGITKAELAAYYEAIAPMMLPHLRGRPITMERYPAGIGAQGFWQKDVSKGFPAWLKRVTVKKKGGVVRHPIVTDVRSLLWITNQNTITHHVWTSRAPKLDFPDVCVFDLDPSIDDVDAVRRAAMELKDLLSELGLPSWIKTSGSKGFHIVVPLDRKTPMGVAARFANAVGTPVRPPGARSADAGIQQSRSWPTHLRRYRQERLQRDVRSGLYRAGAARRTGLGAVFVGRDRARHGRPAVIHPSEHGEAHRPGRGSVGRHAPPGPIADTADRAAAQVDGVRRRVAAAVAGVVLALLLAPHTYSQFPAVRIKVIRAAVGVTGETLRVPIAANRDLEFLTAPFAAIAAIRNDSALTIAIDIALDDLTICRADIAPGASQRIDCQVRKAPVAGLTHTATFSAAAAPYTIESFELASHHGALAPGPRNLIIVPEGAVGFRHGSRGHALLIALLIAISVASIRDTRLPSWLKTVHLVACAIVAAVILLVTTAGLISQYGLLIQDVFLERLLTLTALPLLVAGAVASIQWLWRRRSPLAASVAAGLLVGLVFLAYAVHRVETRYRGNVSGLVSISHRYFDRDPLVSARQDLRQQLFFDGGGGSDGQFYFLNTFDPFLSEFRDQPLRYAEFIDHPPYRYGRIGFTLLTKALSLDQPARYPITMVAIVIASLAIAGALLGRIAQHHGLSGWYGTLIVLVPGFWQSVESAMPEPVAIAFLLGACLCALRQRWWVCGLLLAAAMLVRETGGVLVLAIPAAVALTGKRREAALVTVLAFLPIVLWKCYLGWIFWPAYGAESVFHMPNNTGLPFGGVVEMWRRIDAGSYFDGNPVAVRAAISCAVLTTAAAALGIIAGVRRVTPIAIAAGLYGLLTISYNYDGVWLHMTHAQRLTVDLFVALALVFTQSPSSRYGAGDLRALRNGDGVARVLRRARCRHRSRKPVQLVELGVLKEHT